MNRVVVFFLGILTGVALTLIILIGIGYYAVNNYDIHQSGVTYTPSVLVESDNDVLEEDSLASIQNRQYIEVTGRKGEVSLYINMPKDSVKCLLGKPSRVNMNSYGPFTTEEWNYDLPGRRTGSSIGHLKISFRNGLLQNVNEY